ncbi:UNVERIFIED_CONTAM: Fatty-acid-binding protein 1 [Sesamum angustifolium]|uniref:Fatty-acid-binding protein 1 n=1 Tax=Sesamum angustifolium TaxID=2727405 RepID=A0AAW2NL00_9LAMI
MPTTTVNDVAEKTEMLEIDTNSSVALKSTTKDTGNKQETERPEGENEKQICGRRREERTRGTNQGGNEGGGRAGIYADNEKLKDLLKTKIGKAPSKLTREMYQMVIDSNVGMMVRLVIVFSGLTMSMVRKSFDEGLGASIKKLTGGKNEELTKRIMGEASDDIKLTPGSVIEISRLPGYTLQTKVKDEVVSTVDSELLCRAFMYMYLGEDPFDKEAKEKFGTSLLSLF